MRLSCNDLVSIDDLTDSDVDVLMKTAASFKDISSRQIKKVPTLRGRTIINFFMEPSTRTKTSFEIAGKRLSADVINISGSGSALEKGESFEDTARTIEAMSVDAVVLRHWSSGAAAKLADLIEPHVINGGDGLHQHPTQALLDLFTMRDHSGPLSGARVAIVGDISHSRVARSLIPLLVREKADVTIVAPPVLIPAELRQLGVSISYSLDEIIGDVDILYLLRVQKERLQENLFSAREYAGRYGLNRARWQRCSSECKILHPGPMNRGIEIDDWAANHIRNLAAEQVANGVAMRMAIFYLLIGAGEGG